MYRYICIYWCTYIYIYMHVSIYIYMPRSSKGLRFGTPIECALRGYVSTPLSRTKKTQQDMVTTMLIAPFLGETVGGELNNKKMIWENPTRKWHAVPGSDTLLTRIKGCQKQPLSLKGWRFGTPANPTDTRMTRLTRAIFGVLKKKTQKHSFRGLR